MDQWLVRTSKNWVAGPYLKSQVIEMIQAGQLTQDDEICAGNGYWIFLHERGEVLGLLGIELKPSKGRVRNGEEITEVDSPAVGSSAGQGAKGTKNTQEEITDPGLNPSYPSDPKNTAVREQIQSYETSDEVHETTGMIPMLSSLPTEPPPSATEKGPVSKIQFPPLAQPVMPDIPPLDPSFEKHGDVKEPLSSIPLPSEASTYQKQPHGLSRPFIPPIQTTGQIERPSFWKGMAWVLFVIFLVFAVALARLLKY